jgi:hypothetical protein
VRDSLLMHCGCLQTSFHFSCRSGGRCTLTRTAREKGPPSVGRMWLDQLRFLRPAEHPIAIHFLQNINATNNPSVIRRLAAPSSDHA